MDKETETYSYISWLLVDFPYPYGTTMTTFQTSSRNNFKFREEQINSASGSQVSQTAPRSEETHLSFASGTLIIQRGLLVISYCFSSKLQTQYT